MWGEGHGGKTHHVGNQEEQVDCIYKCICSPKEKLLAHEGMLNEYSSRSFHAGMDEKVTQGSVQSIF